MMSDGFEELLGHAGAGHVGDLRGGGNYRPKAQTSCQEVLSELVRQPLHVDVEAQQF
jgi:hypothetical protein